MDVTADGTVYQKVLLLIETQDARGRPTLCRMIHEDDSVTLQGGEQFLVAFIPATFTNPRVTRHASA